jgi:hypothetical protein
MLQLHTPRLMLHLFRFLLKHSLLELQLSHLRTLILVCAKMVGILKKAM